MAEGKANPTEYEVETTGMPGGAIGRLGSSTDLGHWARIGLLPKANQSCGVRFAGCLGS